MPQPIQDPVLLTGTALDARRVVLEWIYCECTTTHNSEGTEQLYFEVTETGATPEIWRIPNGATFGAETGITSNPNDAGVARLWEGYFSADGSKKFEIKLYDSDDTLLGSRNIEVSYKDGELSLGAHLHPVNVPQIPLPFQDNGADYSVLVHVF